MARVTARVLLPRCRSPRQTSRTSARFVPRECSPRTRQAARGQAGSRQAAAHRRGGAAGGDVPTHSAADEEPLQCCACAAAALPAAVHLAALSHAVTLFNHHLQGFKEQIYDIYRYLPPETQVRTPTCTSFETPSIFVMTLWKIDACDQVKPS